MKQYTIGVDLGGTNIAAGLVDAENKIVDLMSCKTNLPRPSQEIEQAIAEICRELAKRNHLSWEDDVALVGIGAPGSVNARTGIVDVYKRQVQLGRAE